MHVHVNRVLKLCVWMGGCVWCVCVCVYGEGSGWMDGLCEWVGVWREVNRWVCMSVGCDCVGIQPPSPTPPPPPPPLPRLFFCREFPVSHMGFVDEH